MKHEEYIDSIHKQQSLIRRLFKRRSDISTEIEKITTEYYKDIIGKFFYVSPENRDQFKSLGDGYYFIYGVSACSNYIMDDKVEVNLFIKQYGYSSHGFEDVIGVDVIEKVLRFAPSTDIKSRIEPLIVSKEEALKHLREYCDKVIDYFSKVI